MRSYYALHLDKEYVSENAPKEKFKNLVKTMPPKYKDQDKEGKVREGFFGITEFDNGVSMNHYFRRDKKIRDPYTKEDIAVSELKVSRISYVSDGPDDDLFIMSYGLERGVFNTLNLTEDDYQLISFNADFIRFLNTSTQNHRCYKGVFNNAISSIGRGGQNDQGHKLREEYKTLNDREANIGTDMSLYALLAVTTEAAGVIRLFLHNNGKMTIVNDGTDFTRTSNGISELIATLKVAHTNYSTCIGSVNANKN